MNLQDYSARITWDNEKIVLDSELKPHPPTHHERAWSVVQAWGAGRPDASMPEGIYVLLSKAPHVDYFPTRATGAVALTGELRRRGCPEWQVAEIKREGDRRMLLDLRVEVVHMFAEAADEVWHLLENEPALGQTTVRAAVIRLSKGEYARLIELVSSARQDTRDVLLWAQQAQLV